MPWLILLFLVHRHALDGYFVQSAMEQGKRRLKVWKTTQAAMVNADKANTRSSRDSSSRSWDPATHTLCVGLVQEIVEHALQRIDHRPDLKTIER